MGSTGSNQFGILISKSSSEILFSQQQIEQSDIPKRLVKIKWQNDFVTESAFTYYLSKGEFRITRFGRGFPFWDTSYTGALFVLTKQSEDDYCGFFLNTEDEIEEFLNAFGISPTETNCIISREEVRTKAAESMAIKEYISRIKNKFPSTEEMATVAREIQNKIYGHKEYICTDPDQKIIDWTETEFKLFRAVECARYGELIEHGFQSVDEFVKMANMVLNRRKSRAGKSLEHHLTAIFEGNYVDYDSQKVTEGHKKPDFLFPSCRAYHDPNYSTEKLIFLAAKTTCKDRWRQVLNEADRLKGSMKYLFTLQRGISETQMDEMQSEKVTLVVPKPYIVEYPENCRERIWTLAKFVEYVKITEGR